MENSPIEEMGPDSVKLKDGRTINCDLTIWTAGIEANRILGNVNGLILNKKNKIIVDSNLALSNHKNIFAIGDNTEFTDPALHKPLPAMAYIAIDQGKIAAKNIYSSIVGKQLKTYKPFYDVWAIPVGGKFAIVHLPGNIHIRGLFGWIIRELIDLRYMLSILPLKKAVKIFWEEISIFTKND